VAETGSQSRWIYRRAWRWRRDRAIIAASLGGTGGRHRSLATAGEQGRGGGGGGGGGKWRPRPRRREFTAHELH